MVRDRHKPSAQALQKAGAELIQADFNDRTSLDRALQAVYGVFSMQDFREGAEVEIRHGQALADAASSADIPHFVYSSVGSAERNTGIPHFDSKFQVEEYIRSIGLPHTILRPVFFFYNYNGMRSMVEAGTLFQPLSPETKLQQLSEEDYGAMVAEVFERPTDFMTREIEVASVEMSSERTGLRPKGPDDLPILGRSTAVPGLIYATAHYRNGVMFAPLTVQLVGDLVFDRPADPALRDLDPARVGRL